MPFYKTDPETVGIIMAILIAILRVIYDKEETAVSRIVMESTICGCLAVTANAAISAMSLAPEWTIFAGGMIGYLGSMTVRRLALKFLSKKFEGNS